MRPDIKLWGSQSLTGAASLGYRMPVSGGCSIRIAQLEEHQADTLTVAGSNPVTSHWSLVKTANPTTKHSAN